MGTRKKSTQRLAKLTMKKPSTLDKVTAKLVGEQPSTVRKDKNLTPLTNRISAQAQSTVQRKKKKK